MFNQLILAAAEAGFNAILRTDPVSLNKLGQLKGNCIEICCLQPQLQLYLLVHEHEVQLASHWDEEADCRLSASASQLISLLVSQNKSAILHQPGVSIDGNSSILSSLTEILDDMQLDWEFQISQWLGPLASSLISSHLRSRAAWLKSGASSLQHGIADYLTEETRLLVGKTEAEIAFKHIEQLKLRLDRLTARVELLTQEKQSRL